MNADGDARDDSEEIGVVGPSGIKMKRLTIPCVDIMKKKKLYGRKKTGKKAEKKTIR